MEDLTADEKFNEGLDFALIRLCEYLGVDPHMVSFDAATETVEGDVSAVIGNILCAKYGENFDPKAPALIHRLGLDHVRNSL
jgi:hypothetical protein